MREIEFGVLEKMSYEDLGGGVEAVVHERGDLVLGDVHVGELCEFGK